MARSLRIFAPLFFIGLTAYSVYNAYTPVVRRYEISINKKLERPLRIGMASDLHTGILVGARQLDKLADTMQARKSGHYPAARRFDWTIMSAAYRAENMQPHLERLHAPLGRVCQLGQP